MMKDLEPLGGVVKAAPLARFEAALSVAEEERLQLSASKVCD